MNIGIDLKFQYRYFDTFDRPATWYKYRFEKLLTVTLKYVMDHIVDQIEM